MTNPVLLRHVVEKVAKDVLPNLSGLNSQVGEHYHSPLFMMTWLTRGTSVIPGNSMMDGYHQDAKLVESYGDLGSVLGDLFDNKNNGSNGAASSSSNAPPKPPEHVPGRTTEELIAQKK